MNPVYRTVTMLKTSNNGDFATGFFYNFMGETYIVTNKHVLQPPEDECVEEINYFIRGVNGINEVSWIRKTVDPKSGDGCHTLNVEDESDSDVDYTPDVAVIPINQKLSNFDELINNSNPSVDTGSLGFSPNQIMGGGDIVAGGDIVLIIGYPDGILDSENYLPLIRDARISTPFGVNFQNERKFITDALMYPGMSGSPIVAGPRTLKNPATGGLRTSSRGFALLGIHSDNYRRNIGDTTERLNLNAGWYARIINQILINKSLDEIGDDDSKLDGFFADLDKRHPNMLEFNPAEIVRDMALTFLLLCG